MSDTREKLIALLSEKQLYGIAPAEECPLLLDMPDNDEIADHLIANGVTVQEDGLEAHMNKCKTCFHRAVCYVPVLEHDLGGKVMFRPCSSYAPEGKLIAVDEDMALALVAGAAASENMARRVSLFEMGGNDQRTISFSEAARALRRAGEKVLRRRGVCDG